MSEPVSVVLAGGGTAGHVEPALAVADAVRARRPGARITMLGTAAGLEARLVPARGYPLATIPRVPLPRRPRPELLTVPARLFTAVRRAGEVLDRVEASVVAGFGGYVALPAYLAGRRRGLPLVVHEANLRPGLANRLGARLTPHVAVSRAGTALPHARVTGLPLRSGLVGADRPRLRPAARARLGLPAAGGPTLLVFGGSQGARRLNLAAIAAAPRLLAAGVSVLHVAGAGQLADAETALADAGVGSAAGGDRAAAYRLLPYVEPMLDAYAACDLAVCRAGAMTCAELAAVGMPAIYVPLPLGNGEQRLNAMPTVAAGGGLLEPDADLTGERLAELTLPLLADPGRLAEMGRATRAAGAPDAAGALADLILSACGMIGP